MFPPNRLETAKYISQMLGETTVVERQYSVSGKRAGMMHGQVTESIKSDKRPLLTTDEVMALPGPKKNSVGDIEEPGEMIIRVSGFPPIRGRQPLYFMDDVFLARARIPAPLETDRIGMELTDVEALDVSKAASEEESAAAGSEQVTSEVIDVSRENAEKGFSPDAVSASQPLDISQDNVSENAVEEAEAEVPGLEPCPSALPEPSVDEGDGVDGDGVEVLPENIVSPEPEARHEAAR